MGGARDRTDGRHVWQATVDAPPFESDAPGSTEGTEQLRVALQDYLSHSHNDEKAEKIYNLVQKQLFSADPSIRSSSNGAAPGSGWDEDCESLFSLYYAAFTGRSLLQEQLDLDLTLYCVKWFPKGISLLDSISQLQPHLMTECFSSLVLLHTILQSPLLHIDRVTQLLDKLSSPSTLKKSSSPLWLKHSIGSSHPYCVIIESISNLLRFFYKLPLGTDETFKNELDFYNILLTAERIHSEILLRKKSKPVDLSSTDLALNGGLRFLNGIVAFQQEKYTLAANEYKSVLEMNPKLSCVLFNAYLVYKKSGYRSSSISCLQLLLKASISPALPVRCLPWTQCLLREITPHPTHRAVGALLGVVCVRYQMWKEASDHLNAVLGTMDGPRSPSMAETRRSLVPASATPPSLPPWRVLAAQAALTAVTLGTQDLLQKVLDTCASVNGGSGNCDYYNLVPTQQVEEVSRLLCSVVNIQHKLTGSKNMQALRDAVSVSEETVWVSLLLPTCLGPHSLLLAAPILVKSLCYSFLSQLHGTLGNDTNVRHFSRRAKQCKQSANEICKDTQEKKSIRKSMIQMESDLGTKENPFDLTDSPKEVESSNGLESVVSACNDADLFVPGLDEITTLSLLNIVSYLVKEVTKIKI